MPVNKIERTDTCYDKPLKEARSKRPHVHIFIYTKSPEWANYLQRKEGDYRLPRNMGKKGLGSDHTRVSFYHDEKVLKL